jgi:hypothetical protein
MSTANKRVVALVVERSCQQWIVRDPEGNVCLPPAVADPPGPAPTVLPEKGSL